MALSAGTRLGPYEILSPIGAGGMGEVYRARDSKLQRDVSLLARTYTLVGEQEKAIDMLESLLGARYFISPAWLKIDPNFDPLRSNPRFQKLVAAAK